MDTWPPLDSVVCMMCGQATGHTMRACFECDAGVIKHQHRECTRCGYTWIEQSFDEHAVRWQAPVRDYLRHGDYTEDESIFWSLFIALARQVAMNGPIQLDEAAVHAAYVDGDALMVQHADGAWQIFLDDEVKTLDDADEGDDDDEYDFWISEPD